ncbi:MAG: hypothetical protein OXF56_08145 [Rhodobacteraceae bacterium]|nr:hypothetical protein [Paracoccaceae bacterium]
MTKVTRESAEGLPKVELHVHVEACISGDTIEKLAGELDDPMIRPKPELFRYGSLAEFLSICECWVDLLRTEEIAEQVAYVAARLMHEDDIVYAEVFTGPRYRVWLHDHVQIEAMCRGFARAHQDGFTDCYLIPSISREQLPEWAMDIVDRMVGIDQVVGLSPDGNEAILGRTSEKIRKGFRTRRRSRHGLKRTLRRILGSVGGVSDDLNFLDLDRINHCVRAIEDPELVEHLAERRVPLRICPTSNVITELHDSITNGLIDAFYRAGVPVTVNSDHSTRRT